MTAAAKTLGVRAPDLRRLVWSSSLANTIFEQLDQTFDEALQVLHDGLKSNDKARRLQAATALLTQTEAGRRRSWGKGRALPDEAAEGRPYAKVVRRA